MTKEEIIKAIRISPILELEGPHGKYVIDLTDTLCILHEMLLKEKSTQDSGK